MRAIASSIIFAVLAVASTASAKPLKARPMAVDPQATDALRRMSAFLREQQSFGVITEMETDYVLENGQKVRLSSHGDLRVQRPSRLRARVVSDRKDREFFYDGKTFTLYSPKLGYYATLPAPPTIADLADHLTEVYGLELPLVDLFRWNKDTDFSELESARFVGTTKLNGIKTDQYAFRQRGVDWQIWIDKGNRPLPRKILLTTTDDKTRPEHSIELSWQLNATHQDSTFAFKPPKSASKIAIAELGMPRADKTRRAKRSARR
jgi:hypothetical protein